MQKPAAAQPNPILQEIWDVKTNDQIKAKNASIVEILKRLQAIEKEIAQVDKFVEYIVKKYKPFKFDVQMFMKDDLIKSCSYAEQYLVEAGQF